MNFLQNCISKGKSGSYPSDCLPLIWLKDFLFKQVHSMVDRELHCTECLFEKTATKHVCLLLTSASYYIYTPSFAQQVNKTYEEPKLIVTYN
jgi:hypothetical protein